MRKRGEKDVVEELGAGYVMEAMGSWRGRLEVRAASARLRGFLGGGFVPSVAVQVTGTKERRLVGVLDMFGVGR